MRKFVTSVLFLFLLAAAMSVAGQEDIKAKHDAYYRCINLIPAYDKPFNDTTKEAFRNCSDYLQKYPNDDPNLVSYVKRWTTAYPKISAYLESIKKYVQTKNSQSWMVYQPDLKKQIPITVDTNENHEIEIARQFSNATENKYLKTAEAVYPNASGIAGKLFKNWSYWSQSHTDPPLGEMQWWTGYSDTILSTEVVTTSAVVYYYDVSQKLRSNSNKVKENSFTFYHTNLKYDSSIKKFDKYEHSGKSYDDVYVADMNLTWGQVCGGLCGHGFTRNKIVVLDKKGRVLDLFLDAKVNFSSWVS